jgi:hypothetical protein
MKARWIWFGGKMILWVAVLATVLGGLTMLLWNALVPSLFHGPEITYVQALGMLLLARVLVGGWGRHPGAWRHDRWRSRMREHYAHLTPEEREKMRSDWRRYCGYESEEEPDAEPDKSSRE